jgi:uncharacterized repeat protein (TIGR02543 family)
MNLFEKIRELKFPFIALVAAMTFSGLVAPAQAVAPTVAMQVGGATGSTSYSVGYRTSGGSGTCKSVVRLASSSAITAAEVIARTGVGAGDVYFYSRSAPDTFGHYDSLSGLTGSTAYTYYVACTDGTNTSALATRNFTTDAPLTLITFNANRPVGVAANVTGLPIMNPALNNGSLLQMMMMGMTPFLAGYTFGGWQTTTTGGTLYSVTSTVPTSSDITLYAKWTAIGAPPQQQQQQNQQQVTASVRPAPAFNITNRPAVSANGQTLTLNGENLSDVTAVKVAGKEAKISKKASGEIVIDVPAGTEGFPDVELLHAGGAITMQGLIQVIKPYSLTRSLNINKFVGNRPTLAGIAAIEQAYLAGITANILTCVATVASDASAEEIAKTETRANATCQRVVNYSKYIKTADVQIKKDGAAGSKPVLAVTFDRTLDGK